MDLFQTFHTPSFGDEEFDIPLMHTTTAHQVDNFQIPVNMNLLSNDASSYNQWNHTLSQEPQLLEHNSSQYDIETNSNHSNYQQQMLILHAPQPQIQNRNSSPQVYTGRSPASLEANGSTSDDSEDNVKRYKFCSSLLKFSNYISG